MNDLVLLESTIQLSNNLVNLLGAKTGDRIVIGYASNDGTLIPAISIGDSGNKLSGKNTIVFRGKQRNCLAKYGTTFKAVPGSPITLIGDNPEFKVFTSVEKATEYTLSKEIITNENYNIKNFESYEF